MYRISHYTSARPTGKPNLRPFGLWAVLLLPLLFGCLPNAPAQVRQRSFFILSPQADTLSFTGYAYDSLTCLRQHRLQYPGGPSTQAQDSLVYRYDASNRLDSLSRYVWRVEQNVNDTFRFWQETEQILYTYPTGGALPETEMRQAYDLPGDTFLQTRRLLYTYDSLGRTTSTIRQDWNAPDSAWDNQSRDSIRFDSLGRLEAELGFVWRDDSLVWEREFLRQYSYNANGRLVEETDLGWNGQIWVPRARFRTEHFVGVFLDTTIRYADRWEGDIFNGGWQANGQRTISYFDSARQVVEQVEQVRRLNRWAPDKRRLYTYDSDGRLLRLQHFRWDIPGEVWRATSTDNTLFETCTGELLSRGPRQAPGTTAPPTRVYPNPLPPGGLLHLNPTPAQPPVLLDLQGRTYPLRSEAPGSWRLPPNLARGVYLLRLPGGGARLVVQ